MQNKHLLIILSGPSGVGKGTIVQKLLNNGGYALSISCTTRALRPETEKEGVSYFFISKSEFIEKLKSGGFLEYSEHFGNLYGTPRAFVEEKLKTSDVILEIEVDGAMQVKKAYPQAVLIMIVPPSEQELFNRLKSRHTESDEKIKERLSRAGYELSRKDEYDFVVVNDKLDEAVEQIERIIEGVKQRND